jgi:uncharacterized membrane protein YgaE (UPF0421/DUF939 family)
MIRDRLLRVRDNALLAGQAGVAAGLAWFVAHDLIGHQRPFFAPVAAVVALGSALGQRLRRVVELVLGVALGILVGDAFVYLVGTGPVQLGVVVALAVLIAVFFRGGSVLVTQSASSAVLIATLQPPSTGLAYPRFIDALVGGGIGIVATALLLPPNPLAVAQRAAHPLLDSIADGFEQLAAALDRREKAVAEDALEQLRDTNKELAAYDEALAASREAITLAPLWWRRRDRLSRYVDSAPDLDRVARNARVLARRAVALLRDDEPVPTDLLAAVDALGAAVRVLGRELAAAADPVATRELACSAVRHATAAQDATMGFSGAMIVGQIRFAATDLLRATGMDRLEAEGVVRTAASRPGRR